MDNNNWTFSITGITANPDNSLESLIAGVYTNTDNGHTYTINPPYNISQSFTALEKVIQGDMQHYKDLDAFLGLANGDYSLVNGVLTPVTP